MQKRIVNKQFRSHFTVKDIHDVISQDQDRIRPKKPSKINIVVLGFHRGWR